MNITLVRSATLILETTAGRLARRSDARSGGRASPDRGHREPRPQPDRRARRSPRSRSCADSTACLVTHCHKDHLDDTAERLLPRDLPVFCQPEDEAALRELGLDARPRRRVARVERASACTGCRHSMATARSRRRSRRSAASCSTSSTSPATRSGTRRSRDDRAVRTRGSRSSTPAAPRSSRAGSIVMGVDDVREVVARVPSSCAVHLEALNHCFLTRADLAAAVPGV